MVINTKLLKDITKKLLKETEKIIQGPNNPSTPFQKVLEAIATKAYFRLYAIDKLSQDNFCGDSILDLTRGLIEDMLGTQYMITKGKDEEVETFLKFESIETKNDIDFLRDANYPLDTKSVQQTENDYNSVKNHFTRLDGTVRNSWLEISIKKLLIKFVKEKVIEEPTKKTLLQVYIQGCRKNHLSPTDIRSFQNQKLRDLNQEQSLETGLTFSIFSYYHIAKMLAKEFNNKELENKLNAIYLELNGN